MLFKILAVILDSILCVLSLNSKKSIQIFPHACLSEIYIEPLELFYFYTTNRKENTHMLYHVSQI